MIDMNSFVVFIRMQFQKTVTKIYLLFHKKDFLQPKTSQKKDFNAFSQDFNSTIYTNIWHNKYCFSFEKVCLYNLLNSI